METSKFIDASRKMISFDTTPSQGNKNLVLWLKEFCISKGFHVEIQEEVWENLPQCNIIVRLPLQGNHPHKKEDFLLQAHLDTVDPGPFELWKNNGHNPFDAHIIDQQIYGLGAADVKLDFLCKLEAMEFFLNYSSFNLWRSYPVLVGTFGEETGMNGALKLIRKNKIFAKKALIAEPTDLHLVTAGKGYAQIEIRIPYEQDELKYREDHNLLESSSSQTKLFRGKAAHSSTPYLGESAIVKMFDYLQQMPSGIAIMEIEGGVNSNTVPVSAHLELDIFNSTQPTLAKKLVRLYEHLLLLESEMRLYQNPAFIPSHTNFTVGFIRNRSDHILISLNCRLIPMEEHQPLYESWMQSLQEICAELNADFSIIDYKKPFQTEINSPFVQECLNIMSSQNLPTKIWTQSSTNEASLFSRVGIECISFGAGQRDGNIHTPNEHVHLDQLKKATEFYKKIISTTCLIEPS